MTQFTDGRLSRAEAAELATKYLQERINNAAQAMSETHSSWESRCFAIMAGLGLDFGNPSSVPDSSSAFRWLPISQADRTIVHQQHFPSVGLTLRNSERYWVRDEDGRVYEASWTEGKNGRDYWWDWDSESPVDPVEFCPHPCDPRFAKAGG